LRQQINVGVFFNVQENEIRQLDVLELLDSVEGNVLYLDLPYAGIYCYGTSLRAPDSIIERKMVRQEASTFIKAGASEQ